MSGEFLFTSLLESLRMWIYHLTQTKILPLIKEKGLRSSFSRTGGRTATSHGAFAQDRAQRMPKLINSKLTGYVGELLAEGFNRQEVRSVMGHYIPFNLAPTASIDDNETLTRLEAEKLKEYKTLLRKIGGTDQIVNNLSAVKKKWTKFDVMKNEAAKAFGESLALSKVHYLSRLAVQSIAFQFKIEETITASHIYFFKEAHAVDCFRDYTKHLGGSVSVLRIDSERVASLEKDMSEHRGMMTEKDVLPSLIQVMKQPGDFTNNAYRLNDDSWQAL